MQRCASERVSLSERYGGNLNERRRIRRIRVFLPILYAPAILFFCLDLFTELLSEPSENRWGWDTAPSLIYYISIIWSYAMIVVAIGILIRHIVRAEDSRKRIQGKYFLAGMLIPVVVSMAYYGAFFAIETASQIPDPTTSALVLGFLVIGYAIKRYGLFKLSPQIVWETVVPNMSNLFILVGPDKTIIRANPALYKTLGYGPNDLENADFSKICDVDIINLSSGTCSHDGIEVELQSKTGAYIPVLLTLNRFKNPSGQGLICIGTDLTEQKRAERDRLEYQDTLVKLVEERTSELETEISERKRVEKTLLESEEKYRLLVEHATDAIFIIKDGRLEFINPMMNQLTGYQGDALLNMPFEHLIHPEERDFVANCQVEALNEKSSVKPYSFRIRSLSKVELWAELNSVAIRWNGGAATLNFLRDITKQKTLESQLALLLTRNSNWTNK